MESVCAGNRTEGSNPSLSAAAGDVPAAPARWTDGEDGTGGVPQRNHRRPGYRGRRGGRYRGGRRLPPPMLDRRQFLRARPPADRPAPVGPPLAPPRAASEPARAPVGDLRPFAPTADDPWDAAKARHLLRRVAPAALPADVVAVSRLSTAAAVDRIVTAAHDRPPLAEPDWIDLRHPGYNDEATSAQRQAFDQANGDAIRETIQGVHARLAGGGHADRFARLGTALRERMTQVWANHYVTDLRSHNTATWLFDYLRILDRGALGQVQDVVHRVGTTPAMLKYLNGDQNRVGRPNENYARELLELFTMGVEGPDGAATYTQRDVAELSRALTGWRTDRRRPDQAYFDERRFDDGDKTVFDRTGPLAYDDVTPLLFTRRGPQIAHFLAGVLYRTFVSHEPDARVVAALAAEVRDAGFDLAGPVRTLLQSAHFYDDAHVGAIVKDPTDVVLGSALAFGLGEVDRQTSGYLRWQAARLGQEVLNPPDVSGWPGGTAWIDTSTLTERVNTGQGVAQRYWQAFAADALSRDAAGDAAELALDVATQLLPRPPAVDERLELTEVLLAGSPAYSWDPTTRTARNRVRDLAKHLVSLPAYQLR